MAYALMMYDVLGYPRDDPRCITIWKAIDKLLVENEDEIYCQPCVSPVWDTSLSGHAMIEACRSGGVDAQKDLDAACDWLVARQVTEVRGDWAETRPDLRPAAGRSSTAMTTILTSTTRPSSPCCFTATVGLSTRRPSRRHGLDRRHAKPNGGWGAFDADNDREFLNHIPFSDHGALLDPPTADVTGRCVSLLAQLGREEDRPVIHRALIYLRAEQEPDGSWYGRWGTNYIYGTWSVLCALNAAGVPHDDAMVRRAVNWLISIQRADGGGARTSAATTWAATLKMPRAYRRRQPGPCWA